MAENNIAGFKKLMRYAQNLAEYEQGIAEGIIDENVFVIVLDEKVAKFKGQTFDWSGNGSGGGGSIGPALLEGYMPMMREFSDDFNNDFSR